MQHPVFPLYSAFLALPLEQKAKWQFQALQEELRPFEDIFSFQNPQSPHLTLYFWQELSPIEYRQIMGQAAAIAARSKPFTLAVTGVGTFGKPGAERVLFLTVAFSPELAVLKKLCPWPNPPQAREFSPHITIARILHPQKFAVHRKKIMKACEGIAFSMEATMLRFYAEQHGVKQVPLEDFSFGAELPQ